MKHKKLITNISDQMFEDIKKIKVDHGFFDQSEATRAILTAGISKLNPPYIDLARQKMKNRLTPEQRAEAMLDVQEARSNRKESNLNEAKALICGALEGEEETINGTPHCRYRLYTEAPGKQVDSTEMLEPYSMLSEENVRLQYRTLLGVTGEEARKVVINLIK